MQKLLKLRFQLIDLRVTSESGKKYGKINDFAFDTSSWFVQKMYAAQSVVKNFSGSAFSIDRSQIIEITNKHIVIEDPTEPIRVGASSPSTI